MQISRGILMAGIMAFLSLSAGCGFFSSDDDHKTELAVDESVYECGKPVPAVAFDEAQTITLSVKKTVGNTSSFVTVSAGEYLAPGTYTLGVSVTPRTVAGKTLDQRVFIGDGGWDYNVEATWDEDRQLYTADFKLLTPGYFLITPILVQVIYSDGKASKAKFLVTTQENLAASYGNLVDRGMSLTLSKAFLATLPNIINPIIAEYLGSSVLEVESLAPSSNETNTHKDGVFNVDAAGLNFDVILNDTNSSGTSRGLYIGVANVSGGTVSNGLDILTNVFANLFLKGLNISNIPTMALGLGLGDLVSGIDVANMSIPGLSMPEGLDLALGLDATMYLNLKGYPAETTSNFAVLGGALYVPKNEDVTTDTNGYYVWPAVSVDSYDTMIDVGMGNIKDSSTDVGVAVSQYNINQILQGLMENLSVEIKSINTIAALFSPKVRGDTVDLDVTINPKGIAVDFPSRRIVVSDLKLLLVESGAVNGQVAELSLDITMTFDVAFRLDNGNLIMDLSIEPVTDLSYMHVMKNEVDGLDSLDHGHFVPIIFQYLAGGQEALTLSLTLSDYGLEPRTSAETPGKMVTDNYGNCFLGMALSGIDMDKISALSSGGTGCFIDTAGIK